MYLDGVTEKSAGGPEHGGAQTQENFFERLYVQCRGVRRGRG